MNGEYNCKVLSKNS